MSIELLKQTKIGVLVNKCKKKFQTDTNTNNKCKELIDNWKKIAEPKKETKKPIQSSSQKENKQENQKENSQNEIIISVVQENEIKKLISSE